jgi:hypothetical protein
LSVFQHQNCEPPRPSGALRNFTSGTAREIVALAGANTPVTRPIPATFARERGIERYVLRKYHAPLQLN